MVVLVCLLQKCDINVVQDDSNIIFILSVPAKEGVCFYQDFKSLHQFTFGFTCIGCTKRPTVFFFKNAPTGLLQGGKICTIKALVKNQIVAL